MSEELSTRQQESLPTNPFARKLDERVHAGAVEIESSRAVAEAQGALVIAKKFPRDPAQAYADVIAACSRKGLADEAIYSYPRQGQTVSGPSIRLAEVMAQAWGNIDYGIRELSRSEDASEMEAYCWDKESNVRSCQQFTVRHRVDTRQGGRATRDEREIYELTANMGARRLRARILAILPPDLVDAAMHTCEETMAGNSEEPLQDRINNLVSAFARFGVSLEHIEARLGHPVTQTLPDELADLRKVYTSLKDNMSSPSDWFAIKRQVVKDAETSVPSSKPDAAPQQKSAFE